jgi:hypothetical protein
VTPTVKPTTKGGGHVISLPNVGGPTVDSRHPNQSAGHLIPWGSSPHCILVYNASLPQPVTIVSVSFHVDLAGSTDAGPLQFADHNTDPDCGWLKNWAHNTTGDRAPTCAGVTLGPHVGDPFTGPGCVLRLDIPAPESNVDRTGHFTFVLRMTCLDSTVAPCDLLSPAPTNAHPVTVQWHPSSFYLAACGRDAPGETESVAATGVCLQEPASPSTSPAPGAGSSSAGVSPSS